MRTDNIIHAQSIGEFTVIIAGLVREGLTFEARTDAVNWLFEITLTGGF